MKVEQQAPRSLSGCCSLLGYSRQAFYQKMKHEQKEALSKEILVNEVIKYRTIHRRMGGRKLFDQMKGFMAAHKTEIGRDGFFDLLRDSGLLINKRRRKSPKTTWSNHWMRKYPNLIRGFTPVAPGQLWVSDITYIEVRSDFAYLSLVTDAYSRKIVGFYLSEDLSANGPLMALKMALKDNPERTKLIHHSDRGCQYCCTDYVALLAENKIGISMTESGDPLENAMAERINGILKTEYLEPVYDNYRQAQKSILDTVNAYNYLRPHSSIDMLTPAVAHQREGYLQKHWKSYYHTKKQEVTMSP